MPIQMGCGYRSDLWLLSSIQGSRGAVSPGYGRRLI